MAYADPQTVTINAIANTLPRTSSGVNSGTFSKDDGTIKLSVSSAYGKRTRRTVRVDHQKYAADPLVSSTNVLRSMSAYIVVDVPIQGYTIAEQKQIADGLIAWLSATSGSNVTKLLGGEI